MSTPDMLSSLPVELFELIAEDVMSGSSEDLTGLRQTSSQSAAKVMRLYKKCRFAEIAVRLVRPSSIVNATKIIESRIVGSAVRKITFVDNSLPDPSRKDEEGSEQHSSSADDNQSDSGEDEHSDSEDADADESNADSADSSPEDKAYHTQQAMRETGQDRDLLIKLFDKFGRGGRRSRKLSVVFRSRREEGEGTLHDGHCLAIVMLAIASSSATFKAFTMDVGRAQGIPVTQYGTNFQSGIICKSALSHFKALDLVLNVDEDDLARARDFVDMISKLKIRSLTFKTLVDGEMTKFIDIDTLMKLNFPSTESFEFEHVFVSWDKLVSFLKRQKSLRNLVITFHEATVDEEPQIFKYRSQEARNELSRLTENADLVFNGFH
ncbi:unnamed protein product [Zymoseptoria tritici ST99CH_1A5]|uniref:Uncharacterized protein n=1 Tax=Zymoseptoria tritici ST99CH_1A5 TaxID=1276529 RepID=A0A1Y6LZI7_ZYMTR|nr:unnamed protein product [Zymoseptoria tritici ST99CH_3D1]SMY29813.1 unnamed protein product [Zymoseptoria tritici ST99CH_1A5]